MNLNLGAWGRPPIPGFTNIDIYEGDPIHYQRDVRDLSLFDENSIELIYASHVLQYFDREEAEEVLKEWYRVLQPEGTIRLAVPDLGALIRVYLKTGDPSNILGPLYGKMEVNDTTIYHKTVYTFKTLEAVLAGAGFKDVRKYDWRKTIHKDYDDHSQAYFPHMDKKKGILISLNVEATK